MTSERDWRGLLFVAPFLLLYSVILIFPLLRGMWLSGNQVDLFDSSGSPARSSGSGSPG